MEKNNFFDKFKGYDSEKSIMDSNYSSNEKEEIGNEGIDMKEK